MLLSSVLLLAQDHTVHGQLFLVSFTRWSVWKPQDVEAGSQHSVPFHGWGRAVLELGRILLVYSLACCLELGLFSAVGNNIATSFCVQGSVWTCAFISPGMYLSWDGWAMGWPFNRAEPGWLTAKAASCPECSHSSSQGLQEPPLGAVGHARTSAVPVVVIGYLILPLTGISRDNGDHFFMCTQARHLSSTEICHLDSWPIFELGSFQLVRPLYGFCMEIPQYS